MTPKDNVSPGSRTSTRMLPLMALLAGLVTLMLFTILVSREIMDGALRWIVAFGAATGVTLLVYGLGRASRRAES